MRFGLKTLLVSVAILCVVLGAYRTGHNSGRSQGRKEGYDYADAKYKHFLGAYSKIGWTENVSYWDTLGRWFREGRISIINSFDETEYEWNMKRYRGVKAPASMESYGGILDDGHLESFPPRARNSLGPEE